MEMMKEYKRMETFSFVSKWQINFMNNIISFAHDSNLL